MFDGSIEDKKFVNMSSKSFSSDSNVNVEVAVPLAFRVWDAFPAFFSSSSKGTYTRRVAEDVRFAKEEDVFCTRRTGIGEQRGRIRDE